MMSLSLHKRVVEYAIANRHIKKWKARLHAIQYGASLKTLSRIK